MSAPAPDAVDSLVCSAKGCGADATWALLWNNPRLHTPLRRKVWLACDEHREHLTSFLDLRGFLRDTVPADQIPTVDDAPGSEDVLSLDAPHSTDARNTDAGTEGDGRG